MKDDLILWLIRNSISRTYNDCLIRIFFIDTKCLKRFHVQCKQSLAAWACALAADIVFWPTISHVAKVWNPHLPVNVFNLFTNNFNLITICCTSFISCSEVVNLVCIDTYNITCDKVKRNWIVTAHDDTYFQRSWCMWAVTGCYIDSVYDVDIRTYCPPNIHHSHCQVLLMHLGMYLILYSTFDVL